MGVAKAHMFCDESFVFESTIKGYHVYKEICNAEF